MKKILSFLVCLFVLTSLIAEQKQSSQEDAQIKMVIEQFVKAWNSHNGQEMASHWVDDGDVINPWGKWGIGKSKIQQMFSQEMKQDFFNKTFMQQQVTSIRYPSSDVAVVDVDANIRGIVKDNVEEPPFDHHVVYILIKKNGKWWIYSARPYVLFEPVVKFE